MLPPHIIRDILERERARRAPAERQPTLELPLPEAPPAPPRETEAPTDRGVIEIELFS